MERFANTHGRVLAVVIATAVGASACTSNGPAATTASLDVKTRPARSTRDRSRTPRVAHPALSPALRQAHITAMQTSASVAYELLHDGKALTIANEAQKFAGAFDRDGMTITATSPTATWKWQLATTGFGCVGASSAVAAATPTAMRNHVAYARGSALTEWYINGPLGIEQGFTVAHAPSCKGRVEIAMRSTGDLSPVATRTGVALHTASGEQRLAYAQLYVVDAAGKSLPAAMRVGGEGDARTIRLEFDATNALYPVTVDPLVWTQQYELISPDATGDDQFGYAVAASSDGSTVAIGAQQFNGGGAVYVYVSTSGAWSLQQEILPFQADDGNFFGHAVALSATGDTLVVGNFLADEDDGEVLTYQRSGTVYTRSGRFVGSNDGGQLGVMVAVSADGNTVAAGAPYGGATQAGYVNVYRNSGGSFATQTLDAPVIAGVDPSFGAAVALSADASTLVVGAPYYGSLIGGDGTGAVVVYHGTAAFGFATTVAASDGASNDAFGQAVALASDGSTLVVGAPFATVSHPSQGAAYVYAAVLGSFGSQTKVAATSPGDDDEYGTSVYASNGGSVISIGAPNANLYSGAAYVYQRSVGTASSTWPVQVFAPSVSGNNDAYGTAVAGSSDGHTMVFGAWQAETTGAAYVFTGKRTNGTTCATSSDCNSGFCVDGVCCDSLCGGGVDSDCQACAAAKSGGTDGVCSTVNAAQAAVCRASAGVCDLAETCTGTSTVCPADGFVASTTECRASAGACDVAETCTGASAACPVDVLASATTVCRDSAGACDVVETCTGSSVTCPADGVLPSKTLCRDSAGVCDVAESCDGVSSACPADTKVAATTECRAAAGVCDVAEQCDGVNDACPTDGKKLATVECRGSAGACDVAEKCDGVTNDCPVDAVVIDTTMVCAKASGICENNATCDGTHVTCPDKTFKTSVCRGAASTCDVVESCDGVSAACPSDKLANTGTPCAGGTCHSGSCVPTVVPDMTSTEDLLPSDLGEVDLGGVDLATASADLVAAADLTPVVAPDLTQAVSPDLTQAAAPDLVQVDPGDLAPAASADLVGVAAAPDLTDVTVAADLTATGSVDMADERGTMTPPRRGGHVVDMAHADLTSVADMTTPDVTLKVARSGIGCSVGSASPATGISSLCWFALALFVVRRRRLVRARD